MYYNNQLSHHGILGQKWGKRNGPPYPLGSSQKSSSEKKRSNAGKYLDQNIKSGKDKPNKSASEAVIKETEKGIRNLESITRTIKKNRGKNSHSDRLIELSDAELRQAINRLNMEKQYKDLISSDVSSGYDYIADLLDIAGGIASTALSAATIASILYTIKNK